MERKTLSLCIIVKNEEQWIRRCLSSVKEFVDEMIIVDTGSTDRTPDIARSLGAGVYSFPWNGNFAEARNYGIIKASGDWILWLDADEEVDAAQAHHLREVLDLEHVNIACIELINFYGHSPPHPDRLYRLAHHRLFRNRIGLQFKGAIHEQLNVDDVLEDLTDTPNLGVKVYHYGYLEHVTRSKSKFQRNLSMLLKASEGKDPDPWVEYHIASEYYRINDYPLTFEHVNRSIVQFLQKRITPPSMLYKLKYASLILTGSYDGAWPAIEKAIALYPDYVDLHFYKGVILLNKDRIKEAIGAFEHCLALGEDNLNYLTLKGLGSFQPYYYLGQCYEKQKKWNDAKDSYAAALKLSPDHPEASWAYRRLSRLEEDSVKEEERSQP
ncbi:glycosyltransferase family 2 protein [Paenibacillus sp. FJAT-26967]|uniref:glycosyltransferase family 2 protein n=1 Tax=Paenibacillus sp. FJAT-26967 TaxID=1729690 RepID=UPI000838E3DC|nr:glycosyltransferase family 2 protein [Paenibacillus sp. FJAT-26967]